VIGDWWGGCPGGGARLPKGFNVFGELLIFNKENTFDMAFLPVI
jgi:hypothetical protein